MREPFASHAGSFRLGMGLYQVLQGAAGGTRILEFRVGVGHGQHGLGSAHVLRETACKPPMAFKGLFVRLGGVLGISQPVERRWQVPTGRILAQESRER